MNDSSLHEAILSSFLHLQRPPTVAQLAVRFRCSEGEARRGLRTLAEHHGVALHPHSDEVWVAHPFSAAPTAFVVRSGDRAWWGTCAWCSLGLAHLAGGTATIETKLGGLGDVVVVRMVEGRIVDPGFVVHFPIPMRQPWQNVHYTCAVMLLFRNEAEVDGWCAERGVQRGDVRLIELVSAFAAEWYGRHLDADWAKWSTREAAEMFARHGLSGPIWELPPDGERF